MSSPGELGWVMGPRASRITQRGMQARINTDKVDYGDLYKPTQESPGFLFCAILWCHELYGNVDSVHVGFRSVRLL